MVEEQKKQEKEKVSLTQETAKDYLILKKLSTNEQANIRNRVKKGLLKLYKTQYGVAVRKDELIDVLSSKNKIITPKAQGYEIDLSTNSRINCLYRRVANMNRYNRQIVLKDNKLTRYVDQDGYMCINLKEYLSQQVKIIAKRLELKEYKIYGALYEYLWKLYKEEKEDDQE